MGLSLQLMVNGEQMAENAAINEFEVYGDRCRGGDDLFTKY